MRRKTPTCTDFSYRETKKVLIDESALSTRYKILESFRQAQRFLDRAWACARRRGQTSRKKNTEQTMTDFHYPTKETILIDIDEAVAAAANERAKDNVEKERLKLQARCYVRDAIRQLRRFGDSREVDLSFLTKVEQVEFIDSIVPAHSNLEVQFRNVLVTFRLVDKIE